MSSYRDYMEAARFATRMGYPIPLASHLTASAILHTATLASRYPIGILSEVPEQLFLGPHEESYDERVSR